MFAMIVTVVTARQVLLREQDMASMAARRNDMPRPFRSFPYGHANQWVRLPAWSVLLVFSSKHSPEIHRFFSYGHGTDGQTHRSIAYCLVLGWLYNNSTLNLCL